MQPIQQKSNIFEHCLHLTLQSFQINKNKKQVIKCNQ